MFQGVPHYNLQSLGPLFSKLCCLMAVTPVFPVCTSDFSSQGKEIPAIRSTSPNSTVASGNVTSTKPLQKSKSRVTWKERTKASKSVIMSIARPAMRILSVARKIFAVSVPLSDLINHLRSKGRRIAFGQTFCEPAVSMCQQEQRQHSSNPPQPPPPPRALDLPE